MKYSESVKPISYLKTHASEVIKDVSENRKTMLITLNGEAKVVLQDVKAYERTQESLSMLKILALTGAQVKKGAYKPYKESFERIEKIIGDFKNEQNQI